MLEKVLERNWRAVVQAGSQERLEALDLALWTYRDDSFLQRMGPRRTGTPPISPSISRPTPPILTVQASGPRRWRGSERIRKLRPHRLPVRWSRRGGRGVRASAVEEGQGCGLRCHLLAAEYCGWSLGEEGLMKTILEFVSLLITNFKPVAVSRIKPALCSGYGSAVCPCSP